ncbi:MAG: 30S ribosomal protein S12 methylthiotransferase RimO [Candidatus Theseobacter exili]|nr:30S ribosomal protein S12 methylthiotransferase RimO [Candidatus Theseobacter exili]
MKINIAFVNLGCAKNMLDGERMLDILESKGANLVKNPEDAQIVIVNTCTFIREATDESLKTLQLVGNLKKSGRCRHLVATGCLAQRYGNKLFEIIPSVDAVLGTFQIENIFEAVEHILTEDQYCNCTKAQIVPEKNLSVRRFTPSHYAYVRIAEGCNNRCHYCIIPTLRGNYRSRKIEDILEEANLLAASGVKEINLIAQDTTLYGKDIPVNGELPDLLKAMVKIESLNWVRLLYVHPAHLHDDVLSVIRDEKKICSYIDLPIQHIDNEILSQMGRKISEKGIRILVEKIRQMIPDVGIRTSLIVGFPGETREKFNKLLSYMKEVRFERLGVFIYSPEEGTVAASYKKMVDEEEKQKRFHEAMLLQQQIATELNTELIGRKMNVICDGLSEEKKGFWQGRTQYDAPEVDGLVYFEKNNKTISPGDINGVLIKDSMEYDLIGQIQ